MSKKRRSLRHFLIALYTIVGALLLLEIALRVFDPFGVVYYRDAARYFDAMTPDPDYGYIHTPGYKERLQDVDIEINGEGLRGPQFDVTKPAGERRLMILGDSVVFGWGAGQDVIFPAVLQRMVGSSLRVISAGVGSWNTRSEYEFLRKRGVDYGLDAVVLVAVANDVEPGAAGLRIVDGGDKEPAENVSVPHRVVRRLSRFSYVFSTFYHVARQRSTSNTLTRLYDDDAVEWRDTAAALDGIIDMCVDLEIPLMVFLYSDFESDFARSFILYYGSYLSDRNVPFYKFSDKVFSKQYRNSIVDGHPNSVAHRIMAEDIFAALEDEGILP